MGRLLLIAALLGAAGCTCEHGGPLDAAPVAVAPEPPPAPPRAETWPAAVVELASRPPATRITVRPGAVEIDNRALVATWPVAAVARARESVAAPGDAPRIHETVPLEDEGGLGAALRLARQTERAATGAGEGAGICDLRVAADVAFADFERVLRETGRAGYQTPRILLGEDDALVAFAWPRGRSSGPSLEEIMDAIQAVQRGDEPTLADPDATGARLRLTVAGARVWLGTERRCADGLTLATVEACLRGLLVTRLVIEVDPEMPFGEVAPWVQRAAGVVDDLAVRSVISPAPPRPGSSR